jgi:hypothetical protein
MASEWEKRMWKPFRERLDKSERKIFVEILWRPQSHNSAGSNAFSPVLLEPIIMSIAFEHYKQLDKLKRLDD